MRMLSGFLGLSGLIWVGVPLLLDAVDGGTQSWPLALATYGGPVVIAGTVATFPARSAGQVVRRLSALWLISVVVAFVVIARASEPSPVSAGAALLFVTVAYGLWLLLPLLAYSYVRDHAPNPSELT